MADVNLSDVQAMLINLWFDDLELLRDFIKQHLGLAVIRHGLTPLAKVEPSSRLQQVLDIFTELNNDDCRKLLDMTIRLCTALQPQEGKRGGQGRLEAKLIPRENDNGEVVRHGPYAYWRTWASGGDWRGTRKIYRSKIYLGRAIGEAIYKKPADVVKAMEVRVLEAIATDTLEDLKAQVAQEIAHQRFLSSRPDTASQPSNSHADKSE